MIRSLMSIDLIDRLLDPARMDGPTVGDHVALLLSSPSQTTKEVRWMYAIIRKNVFDPDKLAHAASTLAEFRALHSAQPGYAGGIEIDTGNGERVVVNLWQTEHHASAGMAVLIPHVHRLMEPLMAAPSQLIAAGEVATIDLAPPR